MSIYNANCYNTVVSNNCIAKSYFQVELGGIRPGFNERSFNIDTSGSRIFVKYPKNHSFDFLNNTNYSNCTDFYTKL